MFFNRKNRKPPTKPMSNRELALMLGFGLGIGMTLAIFGMAMGMTQLTYLLGYEETASHLSGVIWGLAVFMPLGLAIVAFVCLKGYFNFDKIVEEHNAKVVPEKKKGEVIHVSMK